MAQKVPSASVLAVLVLSVFQVRRLSHFVWMLTWCATPPKCAASRCFVHSTVIDPAAASTCACKPRILRKPLPSTQRSFGFLIVFLALVCRWVIAKHASHMLATTTCVDRMIRGARGKGAQTVMQHLFGRATGQSRAQFYNPAHLGLHT